MITNERIEELAGDIDEISWSPQNLLREANEMAERILALRKANREIYAALLLCNESRNRLTPFHSKEQLWINEARAAIEEQEQ